jgi:hypothetical protein
MNVIFLHVGCYYLVDSGYPIGGTFLPPHKSVKYHAQEYRGRARRPKNKSELFSYRHSSLRMVIERSFGVLKARFPILTHIPRYSNTRQRMIVTVYCTVHNFIHTFAHSNEMFTLWEGMEFPTGNEGLACQRCGWAVHALRPEAVAAMGTLRYQMTEMMWIEYRGGGSS